MVAVLRAQPNRGIRGTWCATQSNGDATLQYGQSWHRSLRRLGWRLCGEPLGSASRLCPSQFPELVERGGITEAIRSLNIRPEL